MVLSRKRRVKATKEELTTKQSRLIKLAEEAWTRTLEEFYFPPLNEPRYVFDYTHLEGFYTEARPRRLITIRHDQQRPI